MKYSFPIVFTAVRSITFKLIFCGALTFGCLNAFAGEGAAQTPSGRPVARLVTTSRDVSSPLSTPRRMLNPVPLTGTNNAALSTVATSLEQQAFDLINAERRANGKEALVWDSELSRMARNHSENMARFDFFDHAGPDGGLEERARARGIRGWDVLSENITYNKGYRDPAAFAVERWMLSPKHRSNLLNSRLTRSGIGVAQSADGRVFFTQVFIAR